MGEINIGNHYTSCKMEKSIFNSNLDQEAMFRLDIEPCNKQLSRMNESVIENFCGPNPSLASFYSDSVLSSKHDKLSVHTSEQIGYFGKTALGHRAGDVCPNDSMLQLATFTNAQNSKFDDRAEISCIAREFGNACLSLNHVKISLTKSINLGKNVLDNILQLSLSFANVSNDSDKCQMLSEHFKLLVGDVVLGKFVAGNNLEHSAPIGENVVEAPTSSQIAHDQLSSEHKDEPDKCSKKKISRFSDFLGLFKTKPKNKCVEKKKSRWRKFVNRLNCFKSTD